MLPDVWPHEPFAFSVFVVKDSSRSTLFLIGRKVPGLWELSLSLLFLHLFFNPSLVSVTCGSQKLMSLVFVNAQDAPILALVIDRSFTELMLSFYIPFPFRVSFPFPPDYTVVSRLDVFGTALALKCENTSHLHALGVLERKRGWLRLLCSSYFLLEFEFPWISMGKRTTFARTTFTDWPEVRSWELAQQFTCAMNAAVRLSPVICFILQFRAFNSDCKKMFSSISKEMRTCRYPSLTGLLKLPENEKPSFLHLSMQCVSPLLRFALFWRALPSVS